MNECRYCGRLNADVYENCKGCGAPPRLRKSYSLSAIETFTEVSCAASVGSRLVSVTDYGNGVIRREWK